MKTMTAFLRDDRGVSAVEFTLIAPVLMACFIGIIDIGNMVYQRADMQSALRSGIQYFANGGEDLSRAETIVEQAWTTKPLYVDVTADRFCQCGDQEHVCNALCDDGAYPVAYKRLRATATIDGIVADTSYAATQAIRVR